MADNFPGEFEPNMPQQEFHLKEFIFKYLRYWPLLVGCLLVTLTLAFILLRYATPIYSVKGSLFINRENSNTPGAAELQSILMLPDNLNLKNELEILKSKPLLKRVVQNLGIQTSYFNKGNVRSSNAYGISPIQLEIVQLKDSGASFSLELEANEEYFRFNNGNTRLQYDSIFQTNAGAFRLRRTGRSFLGLSSDNFVINYQSLDQAAAAIARNLKATQTIEQTTILDITLETDNIQYGKDVINELMREYGKMNIEAKRQISQITMQFIDERLDTIKEELGGVETGLLRFREKNEVIDLPSQSMQYFQNYSEVNKQLASQQVMIGVVDYLQQYLGNPANRYKIVPTNLGIEEPTLTPLLTQYNGLQLQRSQLEQTTGPSNSALASLDAALSTLREQMLEALRNVKQAYEIAAAKMREQASRYQTNIRSVPSKARDLLDIERQQKIKQDLYLFLLQKREESAIAAAATIAGSYPLEDAVGSSTPVKPNTRNTYLIALLAGILVPVLIIALSEMLNDKIREREEIVKQTATPVVGEIGHAGVEQTLVVKAGSRSVVAEQFRIMRTNVQYLINKASNPVVLITSSVSGEGKSFIATNYGAVLSLAGKKTVVLEFDIRKPRLLKGLNMQAAKGLSNYIIGGVQHLDEIIQPVPEFSNLFVIGCGPVPPNPSELLLDQRVTELFEQLKQRFDCIIIDTAPVGLVSDAFTLSQYADATLYILRQGYTLKRQLAMVEDLYQQKRLPHMSVVVNDIQTHGRYKGYYGYGGGSYYGYGYGYGGDYFQEETSRKQRNVITRKVFNRRK